MLLLKIKTLVVLDSMYEDVGTTLSLEELNLAVSNGLVVEFYLTPTQSIFINTSYVVSYEIGE